MWYNEIIEKGAGNERYKHPMASRICQRNAAWAERIQEMATVRKGTQPEHKTAADWPSGNKKRGSGKDRKWNRGDIQKI